MTAARSVEQRAPETRRPAIVGMFVGVPLSVVFVWLAFGQADLSAVWGALSDASLPLLAAGVAAMGVVYALQGDRWRRIATPRLRRRWYWETVVAGVAVNNVLPGRVGDILRARWLAIAGRLPGGRAFATVIIDRAFDVAALVLLLLTGLLVAADARWVLGIIIGSLALLLTIGAVIAFAHGYTRLRPRRRRDRSTFRQLARDTLEGLIVPMSGWKAVALGAESLCVWTVWAIGAWFVARALGIDLSPLEVAFVAGALNLGVAIPSSPGFVGTYQWLAVSALALFAVEREEALAFAILMQAVWYVPTTLVGGAFLIRRGLGNLERRRSVRGAAAQRPEA